MKNVIDTATIEKMIKSIRHYDTERFIDDAAKYVAAIKEGRMCCIIHSVAKSGMSRVISFRSCEMGERAYYRQYLMLFEALGYKELGNTGTFRIGGCGMNMVFHTNYTIIHRLHRLGLISKEECEKLAQETPTVL